MAASLSHSICTLFPRSRGAKSINTNRMPSSSKNVVDSLMGFSQCARARARSSGDQACTKLLKEGRQNPPDPKSVDASTLISTSHCPAGENPANSGQVLFQVLKKVAKSITAALQRTSRWRDARPDLFKLCFNACNAATDAMMVGHAVEIH